MRRTPLPFFRVLAFALAIVSGCQLLLVLDPKERDIAADASGGDAQAQGDDGGSSSDASLDALDALDAAPRCDPDAAFAAAVAVNSLNSEFSQGSARLSDDERTVYLEREGKIYVSTLDDGGDGGWADASVAIDRDAAGLASMGQPFVLGDKLYFHGTKDVGSTRDLYVASREVGNGNVFANALLLTAVSSDDNNDDDPWVVEWRPLLCA